MMLAISTSWNAWRYSRAKDIIKEIIELGFSQVELSFDLTRTQVAEMLSLKDRSLIKVISVHNFCPIPQGTSRKYASPDIFSLSSLDEEQRQKALRWTKKTIDTAAKIEAQAVVLHLGRVRMAEKLKELANVFALGEKERFKALKEEMQQERAAKAKIVLSQTMRSLEQLAGYAQKLKIKLGIENRYYFSEIPQLTEMETILAAFPSPPIYYWHDVGHAQVYENLGLSGHNTFLDKFNQRMLGIHLHDIEGISDHRAPLKGKFDFQQLRPYLKKETIKVLEPHYPATASEIIQGKQYLEELFGIR